MKFIYLATLVSTLATPIAGAATNASGVKSSGTPPPACPPRPASPAEQQKIFNDFNHKFLVEYKIPEAFNAYVWEKYIQHNPRVPQGRDAAIAFLAPSANTRNSSIVHSTFANNIGFVHHYEYGTNGAQWLKFIDVYRMNGSCIVEHWDVMANLTAGEINPQTLS